MATTQRSRRHRLVVCRRRPSTVLIMAESRRKTDSQHASDEDRVVRVDEFVRKHASAVDVETLQKKGVKTINYLTVSKVNELVYDAVAKAFAKYRGVDDPAAVEHNATADLLEELEALRRQSGEAQSRATAAESVTLEERDRVISLLERRIDKLKNHIARLEGVLEEFEDAADAGLPSIYQEAQGLKSDDTRYEMKRSVLKTVFEDNVKLQCKSPNNAQNTT